MKPCLNEYNENTCLRDAQWVRRRGRVIRIRREQKKQASIDYFATSLPLLLVFEEDMQQRNEWEAKYLIGLAELELGNIEQAIGYFTDILDLNSSHVGAMLSRNSCKVGSEIHSNKLG